MRPTQVMSEKSTTETESKPENMILAKEERHRERERDKKGMGVRVWVNETECYGSSRKAFSTTKRTDSDNTRNSR